jgi:Ulp1 family protease
VYDRTDRPEIKFITECPQQNNSYDCGIYLLLFANFLAVTLLTKDAMTEGFDDTAWNDIIARLDVSVTEEHATSFRKRVYMEITSSMKTSLS